MDRLLLPIMSLGLVLIVIAIAILAWGKKQRKTKLSRAEVRSMWKTIENNANDSNLMLARQAIIEADKLLDEILKSMVDGKDMGERLRNAQNLFSSKQNYQMAWEAHKVRNRLVHEINFQISNSEIHQTITDFKQALVGLGY